MPKFREDGDEGVEEDQLGPGLGLGLGLGSGRKSGRGSLGCPAGVESEDFDDHQEFHQPSCSPLPFHLLRGKGSKSLRGSPSSSGAPSPRHHEGSRSPLRHRHYHQHQQQQQQQQQQHLHPHPPPPRTPSQKPRPKSPLPLSTAGAGQQQQQQQQQQRQKSPLRRFVDSLSFRSSSEKSSRNSGGGEGGSSDRRSRPEGRLNLFSLKSPRSSASSPASGLFNLPDLSDSQKLRQTQIADTPLSPNTPRSPVAVEVGPVGGHSDAAAGVAAVTAGGSSIMDFRAGLRPSGGGLRGGGGGGPGFLNAMMTAVGSGREASSSDAYSGDDSEGGQDARHVVGEEDEVATSALSHKMNVRVPDVEKPMSNLNLREPGEGGHFRPSHEFQVASLCSGSLDECVSDLGSGSEERTTAGLRAAAKYLAGGDLDVMHRVFAAFPFQMVGQMLSQDKLPTPLSEAATRAALSVLGTLCQEPDLASSSEIILLVPAVSSVIQRRQDQTCMSDAYECLLGVSTGSDLGLRGVKQEALLGIVATDIKHSPPDAEWLPLAIQLLGFLFISGVPETDLYEYKHQLAGAVPALAREMACREDLLKFEVLKVLLAMLASDAAEPIRALVQLGDGSSSASAMEVTEEEAQVLSPRGASSWTEDVRRGVGHILLRTSSSEEFRRDSLLLSRLVADLGGTAWLAGGDEPNSNVFASNARSNAAKGSSNLLPPSKFFLLILQSLKLEIPNLLEQLAEKCIEALPQDSADGDADVEEKGRVNADAAWAALGGNLDKGGGGGGGGLGGPGRLGGLARSGGLGGGPSLESMKSVVATSEDWRSVVNDVVWEPPSDNEPAAAPMEQEEQVDEATGPSEEIRKLQQVLSDCLALLEHAIDVIATASSSRSSSSSAVTNGTATQPKSALSKAGAADGSSRTAGAAAGSSGGGDAAADAAELRAAQDAAACCRMVDGMDKGTLQTCTHLIDSSIKDILFFLQLAQEKDVYMDNGVVSCIRALGKYLSVVPSAHRKRVGRLLGYVLAVKAEDEERPSRAVQHMLPALLVITSETRGCKSLVKRGGHRCLIDFIAEMSRTNMLGQLRSGPHAQGCLVMAADIILNLFAHNHALKPPLDAHDFIPILASMAAWSSVKGATPKITYKTLAMCACVNSSVLESTMEDIMKKRLDLANYKKLPKSMEVIVRFLEFGHRNSSAFTSETEIKELWDITVASCTECLPNWPQLKRAVMKSEYWTRVSRAKAVTQERLNQVCKDARLRRLLAVVAFSV